MQQNNIEGLETIRHQGSNIWLIQIPQEANMSRRYIENSFRETPLRLDSYTFGFLQEDSGE